jgi:amino acid permease
LYVVLLCVALIFCTGDRLSSLRYVSTASVGFVMITCVWISGECIFWYWTHGHSAFRGANAAPLASSDTKDYFEGLPAIAFAFSGIFTLFPVVKELKYVFRLLRVCVCACVCIVCVCSSSTVCLQF